jgi:hypothetical protein
MGSRAGQSRKSPKNPIISTRYGGDGGIRTLDTALDRITV